MTDTTPLVTHFSQLNIGILLKLTAILGSEKCATKGVLKLSHYKNVNDIYREIY